MMQYSVIFSYYDSHEELYSLIRLQGGPKKAALWKYTHTHKRRRVQLILYYFIYLNTTTWFPNLVGVGSY